jgi:hypothetical protein
MKFSYRLFSFSALGLGILGVVVASLLKGPQRHVQIGAQLPNNSDVPAAVLTESVPRNVAERSDINFSEHNGAKEGDVDTLLSEYIASQDPRILIEAVARWPNNKNLILEACLVADSPLSNDLSKFERSDPTNALPNLIRAGLYAEKNDLENFKKELMEILSKKSISFDERRRQAIMLDHLISRGESKVSADEYRSLDRTFYKSLQAIYHTLAGEPFLFGDEFKTAQVAVGFADILRALNSSSLSNEMMAAQFELLYLKKLNPSEIYSNNSKTIADRIAELEPKLKRQSNLAIKYAVPLLTEEGNAALRLQFFIRVRADGEKAAINWVVNEMKAREVAAKP